MVIVRHGIRLRSCGYALLLTLLPLPLPAENIVSRPVGFVRIPVAENGRVLVSLPFLPFDPSVNSVLAQQLTGSSNAATADRILKWDSTMPAYVQAVKADKTGNAEVDKKWVTDLETKTVSPLTLSPGEGFWIENRQQTTQSVYLAGDVVLDGTNNAVLPPSLSLIAYPYSTGVELDKTTLANQMAPSDELTDPSAQPQAFVLGRGYWYNRKEVSSLAWMEIRPYADLFPSDNNPPLIADLKAHENGLSVTLKILCQGAPSEAIDIFYQDGSPTNCFDTRGPWFLAATIPAQGAASIEWTDSGSQDRSRVDQIFARYYLAGRSDIDADHNNIPDVRERFLAGYLPPPGGSTENPPGTDLPGTDGELSGTNSIPRLPLLMTARVIYVDKERGNDTLTGKSPVIVVPDGPKKTIRSGLAAVENGGTMVITQGSYGEHLNVSGKDVSVVIRGHVNISGQWFDHSLLSPDVQTNIPPPASTNGVRL